jgi:sensor histidine kinase YesM
MPQKVPSPFSLRFFLTYNVLVVAALTIVFGLLSGLRGLPVRAAIFALITFSISGTMEVTTPVVDRLTRRLSPRWQLLCFNLLYLVGGAAAFAAAFWLSYLVFGIRMTSQQVIVPSSLVGAGLITAFVGNLIYGYERLRARVRQSEDALTRQALERERLEKLRAEAELSALQARINPHFLFNTLNSLAALIPVDPAAAEEMTQRLSECFRYVLRASHGPVTLENEIAFVEDYLALEKLRFGDRLTVRVEIDPAARILPVPGLIVQPLVENALKHGLAPLEGGGSVGIRVLRRDGQVLVQVEDDGRGLARPERPGDAGGTGLTNVRGRLRSAFGPRATLELSSLPGGGALALLSIPVDEEAPRDPKRTCPSRDDPPRATLVTSTEEPGAADPHA